MEKNHRIKPFWGWFFKGSNAASKPGYWRLFCKWSIMDFVIAFLLNNIIHKPFSEIANNVLFPLSGVFIGISGAWVAAAHSMLDSDEIRHLGEFHKGGYVEYPYAMQIAVLILLTTLVLWGLAGIGVIDLISIPWFYSLFGVFLYALVSCSIRTCWRIIYYSHNLLIAKYEVSKIEGEKKKSKIIIP